MKIKRYNIEDITKNFEEVSIKNEDENCEMKNHELLTPDKMKYQVGEGKMNSQEKCNINNRIYNGILQGSKNCQGDTGTQKFGTDIKNNNGKHETEKIKGVDNSILDYYDNAKCGTKIYEDINAKDKLINTAEEIAEDMMESCHFPMNEYEGEVTLIHTKFNKIKKERIPSMGGVATRWAMTKEALGDIDKRIDEENYYKTRQEEFACAAMTTFTKAYAEEYEHPGVGKDNERKRAASVDSYIDLKKSKYCEDIIIDEYGFPNAEDVEINDDYVCLFEHKHNPDSIYSMWTEEQFEKMTKKLNEGVNKENENKNNK